MSKKQSNIFLGLIIVIVSAFAIFFSNESSKLISFGDKSVVPKTDVYEKEVIGESISISVTQSPRVVITEIPPKVISNIPTQNGYRVTKVVDGDTIDVDINGKIERLRLIGIDTPETVDPRKSVQCFGIEASNKAKELLMGQLVSLEFDDSQGERDKYKRLLAYVILLDGTNFNEYMIREGFAHEYTYDEAYKYQNEFKKAAEDAMNEKRGLWSPDTCSGNR